MGVEATDVAGDLGAEGPAGLFDARRCPVPNPLRLEILTHAPTLFFNCRHCEVALEAVDLGRGLRREQLGAALPPEMLQEFARLSDWVRRLEATHGARVAVDVVDVVSVRGFWKALRHRVRRYPAVLVQGRVEPSLDSAEAAVERLLASTARA